MRAISYSICIVLAFVAISSFAEPDNTPLMPDISTTGPDTSTTKPDTSTTQPDTSTTQPNTSTTQPDTSTEVLKVYPVPEEGCMETTKKRCDEAKNIHEGEYLLPNYCESDGDCYKGRTCKQYFCTGDLKCAVACSDHLTRICDESKNVEGPYTCRTSADCFSGRVCFRCDYDCKDYNNGQQCNFPDVGQCGYYPDYDYGPCQIGW